MASTVGTPSAITLPSGTYNGFGWVCDPACGYGKPVTYRYQLGSTQEQYYVHARRKRPDVLIANMTPLPEIWTKRIQLGLKETTTYFNSTKSYPPKIKSVSNYQAPYWPDLPSISLPPYGDRVRNQISDAVAHSVGESLAEAKETIDAVHKGAMGLYDLYRCLRKGDCDDVARKLGRGRRDACRFADAMVGVDLATKLGLKPTMDLAAEVYYDWRAQNELPGSRLVRQTLFDTGHGTLTNPSYYHLVKTRTVTRKLVWYIRVNHGTNLPVTVDPLETAWDLIPMSFMLGWFADVASHVNSRILPSGWSWVDGSITTRTYSLTEMAAENTSGVTVDSNNIQPYVAQVDAFKRDTMAVVPLPDPVGWTTVHDIVKGMPAHTKATFGKMLTSLEILYSLRVSRDDLCKAPKRRKSRKRGRWSSGPTRPGVRFHPDGTWDLINPMR